MIDSTEKRRWRGPVLLSELVGRVLDPVTARRGFAIGDLMAVWPEIVGPGFAECTLPERIVWSRRQPAAEAQGTLYLRVDGPRAVLVQHETGQIIERINGFLGYAAIVKVKLVQAPIISRQSEMRSRRSLDAEEQARLEAVIANVDDARLRAALARLGHGVLAGR